MSHFWSRNRSKAEIVCVFEIPCSLQSSRRILGNIEVRKYFSFAGVLIDKNHQLWCAWHLTKSLSDFFNNNLINTSIDVP